MKKVIGWGVAILLLIGVIGSASSDNKPKSTDNSKPSTTQTTPVVTQEAPKTEETKKVESTPKATPKVEAAEPEPQPEPAPAPKSSCNPNYSPCVPNSATDLNCPDIGFKVTVIGTDVYHLDADHDGYGCDSY